MKSLPDRVGAKFICISIFRFFLPLFSWVMCYAFNHFKVGEIKTVLFCFWASIKFHTQKFTLTVISLSLFEILKKWASNVFQERILENKFVWHFLKMHAKPVEMEKTCSCPFVRSFCTLFWDDITIICWWKLSKQTSYWSRTSFFSVENENNIFIPNYHDIIPK